MKKFLTITVALAGIVPGVYALDDTLTAPSTSAGRSVTVTALTDNIIRVTNTPIGETPAESRTTVLSPGGFTGRVERTAQGERLVSPSLTVTLDGTTGAVDIVAANGSSLHDSGARTTDASGRKKLSLQPGGEQKAFYGAGERGYHYNLAGDTLVMYNRQNYGYTAGDPRIKQMNITMPLLLSPQGYAIVMDDYAAAEMTATSPVEYVSESPEAVSYYFVSSPEGFKGLPSELSKLTGRQDLPPFWSLGYITSKYGYHTQDETTGVIDTLKREGYPVDGVVLDLYWYGKEEDMGRLAWDPVQWPDPEKMLSDLKARGVNLVAISQPYVLRNGRGVDNYRELAGKGMFGKDSVGGVRDVKIWVGEGGMLDVSNPDTRSWLRDRYKALTDGGVGGWWGDLGEPEVHPDGMYHANGLTTRQYHNLYGNDWSRIIYDLFKEEYPDTRLMTLMRGGTVGLQRFSVFPWSTDVSRSWGGLKPQVTIMLNSSLSGLGYMSHDVGGFAIDRDNPVDPELYVRWLQLGLFSPVLRTHAQDTAEPYKYPEQRDIVLPLIKERYAWLPYNYTLAYENAAMGLPLVRPLGMYDADPAATDTVEDQFLWGRDVMVAPVMEQGAVSRKVVFPSGTWVDRNDPSKVYAGGTSAEVSAPLDVIPVYVRGGALIPRMEKEMGNTGDYDSSEYVVDYYPVDGCGETSFTLFEDDRKNPGSLQAGEYALLDITADHTASATRFEVTGKGSYPGMPESRTLIFRIHNVAAATAVEASSGKATTSYDAASRTLTLSVAGASLPLTVSVKN